MYLGLKRLKEAHKITLLREFAKVSFGELRNHG